MHCVQKKSTYLATVSVLRLDCAEIELAIWRLRRNLCRSRFSPSLILGRNPSPSEDGDDITGIELFR